MECHPDNIHVDFLLRAISDLILQEFKSMRQDMQIEFAQLKVNMEDIVSKILAETKNAEIINRAIPIKKTSQALNVASDIGICIKEVYSENASVLPLLGAIKEEPLLLQHREVSEMDDPSMSMSNKFSHQSEVEVNAVVKTADPQTCIGEDHSEKALTYPQFHVIKEEPLSLHKYAVSQTEMDDPSLSISNKFVPQSNIAVNSTIKIVNQQSCVARNSDEECSDSMQMFLNKSTANERINACKDDAQLPVGNNKEKHFSCNFCDKSFKCKTNLKVHLRTHTERLETDLIQNQVDGNGATMTIRHLFLQEIKSIKEEFLLDEEQEGLQQFYFKKSETFPKHVGENLSENFENNFYTSLSRSGVSDVSSNASGIDDYSVNDGFLSDQESKSFENATSKEPCASSGLENFQGPINQKGLTGICCRETVTKVGCMNKACLQKPLHLSSKTTRGQYTCEICGEKQHCCQFCCDSFGRDHDHDQKPIQKVFLSKYGTLIAGVQVDNDVIMKAIGNLILRELKSIRKDIKKEFIKMEEKIEELNLKQLKAETNKKMPLTKTTNEPSLDILCLSHGNQQHPVMPDPHTLSRIPASRPNSASPDPKCGQKEKFSTDSCEVKSKSNQDKKESAKKNLRLSFGKADLVAEMQCKLLEESETPLKYNETMNDEKLICDVCDKSFLKRRYLSIHKQLHSTIKPYTCKYCEKSFPHKYRLNRHLLTHTGDKPWPCVTCGQRFREEYKVKRHLRIHTKEMPIQCPICPKRLSSGTCLKTHMRYHNGEKPWICEICEKRFRSKFSLARHQVNW
ncbi:unnamed protein product [Clavelina lepadiformis]|uniref:C2H2-type domain-containing protein n=1 Tax=Clavelina lepadiformis TaxID=159417 RepID=A0ABP0GJ59_CLALP